MGGGFVAARMFIEDNHLRLALPLIALPGISPRIVTGRKVLAATLAIGEIIDESVPSPRLRGEDAGRQVRGCADLDNCSPT